MTRFSYKLFFESTFNPMALYKVDRGNGTLTADNIHFVDVNPAYERVNKVKREDVVGKSFADVWPTVEPRWSEILRKCLETKSAVHCEGESAQTNKYLEAIALPISDDMIATVFLDRTELQKSEEKLRKNQTKLLQYRSMLRKLATELTLSEENTRREIASDLHDSIGHALLSQLLDLRKMRQEYELPEGASEILDNTINVTEQMIAESRHLIFELSPPILFEVGLAPALEALADNLLTPHGIRWFTTTKGMAKDYAAADAVCIILYRMSRELLVNVIKHAKAKQVHICVNRGPGQIQVVIDDDGVGLPKHFRLGSRASSGLGLFSIKERLTHIGGDMRIVSGPSGTTVSLLAPLKIIENGEGGKQL